MGTVRKIILTIMIAALCAGCMALAEEGTAVTAHDFLGEWVDQDGTTNINIEAREEGDGYIVNIQRDSIFEDEELDYDYSVWAYDCVYDEETCTLKSISRVTGTGMYDKDDEDIADSDIEYTDAELFFDDAGMLIWSDANESVDDGMEFEHTIGWMDPDYIGPGHHFVGEWNDERMSILVVEWMEGYEVIAQGSSSAFDGAIWYYTCDYDAESDTLVSNGEVGEKYIFTYSEDGEERTDELVYEDGAAVFSLTEDGKLVWDDKKENAGEGRLFEFVGEESVDGAGETNGSVVAPMDPGYDLTALVDGEYPAAFEPAALADGALSFTVYSEDVYDIGEISRMAAGDTFCLGGQDVEVESVDRADDLLINGGMDNGGFTLRAYDEDNCWKVVLEDDYHTYTNRGETTLPLADDVAFTDGWDIEKEPETFSGAEAVAEAITGTDMDSFSPLNTTIRVEDGKIVEIIRTYMP